MKKVIISVLVVCLLAFNFSAFGEALMAEILPSDMEVYYGATQLEVPTYSDGTTVYVPLETLMQVLGGTYEAQEGKVTVLITLETLPATTTTASAETPAVNWEYINYWMNATYGYPTLETYLFDCYYDNTEKQQEVIDLMDKIIDNTDDVAAFTDAVAEFVDLGGTDAGMAKLKKLAK